jgi:hypothetical protein
MARDQGFQVPCSLPVTKFSLAFSVYLLLAVQQHELPGEVVALLAAGLCTQTASTDFTRYMYVAQRQYHEISDFQHPRPPTRLG